MGRHARPKPGTGEKRLAVHVEDHPLEYGDFEGTIPKGEYGGGTVIVWDRGSWTPVFDAHKGYAKGHLEFELHGEKARRPLASRSMQGKPREKRENWLLIKAEDECARAEGDPDILEERPESVKTGREIKDVAGEAPGWSSKTGKIDSQRRQDNADDQSCQKHARLRNQGRGAAGSGQDQGRQEGRPARFWSPRSPRWQPQPPAGRALDPRDQVRRLPPCRRGSRRGG